MCVCARMCECVCVCVCVNIIILHQPVYKFARVITFNNFSHSENNINIITACVFECGTGGKCLTQENKVCDGWSNCFPSGQDEENCGQ